MSQALARPWATPEVRFILADRLGHRIEVDKDDVRGLAAAIKSTLALFPEAGTVGILTTKAGRDYLIGEIQQRFRVNFTDEDKARFSTYFGIPVDVVDILPAVMPRAATAPPPKPLLDDPELEALRLEFEAQRAPAPLSFWRRLLNHLRWW